MALEAGSRSFAQFSFDDLKYVKNNHNTPTIEEMTTKAIELLDADEDGFFLMVEGACIDKHSHSNDLENATLSAVEFDKAVAAALEFAEKDGETLVVVTADHATGGIVYNEESGEYEYTLVYNGELYNTDEIRDELKMHGHKFMGHSDTEVVLKAYVEWKDECVNKFNGIFAFAIWEKNSKRLFFARDRIGVKPLFYSIVGNSFIFASAIKGILAHSNIKPVINEDSIAELMFIGPGRTPGYAVFKNINEVKPACCGYFRQISRFCFQIQNILILQKQASGCLS